MKSRLAVIEGKWFSNKHSGRNTSVRGLFDFLCDVTFNDTHGYHYEMFNDANSFQEIMGRLTGQNGIHYIYVASHGIENGICGSNGETISTKKIKNVVPDSNQRGRSDGIYFGCCHFGQSNNCEILLTAGNEITWIAGYGKSIDFIKSSALDLMFWQHYLTTEGTPLQRIKETASYLNDPENGVVRGLIAELDFRIYYWNGNKKSVEQLIGPTR